MDSIMNLVMSGITEFNELNMFIVLCRLIVLGVSLETFGVVIGHIATAGRR